MEGKEEEEEEEEKSNFQKHRVKLVLKNHRRCAAQYSTGHTLYITIHNVLELWKIIIVYFPHFQRIVMYNV